MTWTRPNLEDYDETDPATWANSPAKSEALTLQAWIEWATWGDYKALPECPEKEAALRLQQEQASFEAWLNSVDVETVKSDDVHNEWGLNIERQLDALDRALRRKMPKRAEQRLNALIEAEAQAAREEFALYDEMGD